MYLDSKIEFGLCRLYLHYSIAGFGTGDVVLPIPPLCQKICAKKNCVDCSWNMSIVFGLSDCIWIVQLRDLAQGV